MGAKQTYNLHPAFVRVFLFFAAIQLSWGRANEGTFSFPAHYCLFPPPLFDVPT